MNPRRRPPVLLLLSLTALAGCGDSATPTDPTTGGEITFLGTVPGFPTLAPASVRVLVREGSSVVADSAEAISPTAGQEEDVSVVVPVTGAGPYVYEVFVRDASGVDLYRTDPDTVPVVSGSTNRLVPPFRYVGPGSDATSISIELSPESASQGETVVATAILTDAAGGEVFDAPVWWRSETAGLEVTAVAVDAGRSVATLRADTEGVDAIVIAELPQGVDGEGTLPLRAEEDVVRTDLMLPRFPGLLPIEARVIVYGSGGAAVGDSVIQLTGMQTMTPDTVQGTHRIAVPGGSGPYTVTATLRDASRDLWETTRAYLATTDDTPAEAFFDYVGPGRNAVALSISAARSPVTVGDTVSATARALDAGGSPVPDAPLGWVFPGHGLDLETVTTWRNVLLRASPTPGTYQVEVVTPWGLRAATSVVLEQRASLGVFIDFESYPNSDANVCGRCPIGTEWADWGITFDFTGAIAPGGTGQPYLVVNTQTGNHSMTEDYSSTEQGWLSGYIHMQFTTPPPQVEFSITYHELDSPPLRVFDVNGSDVTAQATITMVGTVASGWHSETVTVQYAGGIGEIVVTSWRARTWIDDISY